MKCRPVIDTINRENNDNPKWRLINSYDIGTDVWFNEYIKVKEGYESGADPEKYTDLRLQCLNMTANPPFPPIDRDIRYSPTIYFLAMNICTNDCSGNGKCVLSRCTCSNGWHGNDCLKRNCPNSLCYIDIDTIEVQYCSHCSQKGKCNVTSG